MDAGGNPPAILGYYRRTAEWPEGYAAFLNDTRLPRPGTVRRHFPDGGVRGAAEEAKKLWDETSP
jgi:hypothetical protein